LPILDRLKELNVTYEDVAASKIGKSLVKISKHKDSNVAKKVNNIIDKWKKLKKSDKKQTSTLSATTNESVNITKEVTKIAENKNTPSSNTNDSKQFIY
jgi:hypothetical protein